MSESAQGAWTATLTAAQLAAAIESAGGLDVVQQGLTVTCFSCGTLTEDAVALLLLSQSGLMTGAVFGGPNSAALGRGQCPGCGGTRMVHALLHGQISEAWKYNQLGMILLSLGFWFPARRLRAAVTGRWWPNPLEKGVTWMALAIVAFLFGVWRNWH